jgi:ABC-2 type transport system permease protein
MSAVRLGLARTGIEVRQFFRERDSMVFTFAFPVILLFIFGSVFKGQTITDPGVQPAVDFTQYFTAGMIASGVVLSSFQSLAIGIAIERDDGTLKRLHGTPMPPSAYFLGKIGLVLVTSVVQTAVLLAAGTLLFGLDLPTSAELWLRFAWIFVLGTAAGTVLGIAFSSVPRSSRSAGAVVSPVVIVLQFISGIFFVLNQLPTWMVYVGSVFLPQSFGGTEVGGSWLLPQTALVLAAWTVVGLALCLRTFRWVRRDAG